MNQPVTLTGKEKRAGRRVTEGRGIKVHRVFIHPVCPTLKPFSLYEVLSVEHRDGALVVVNQEFDKVAKRITRGRTVEHIWPYDKVHSIQIIRDKVTEPIDGNELWTKGHENGGDK